MPQQEEQLRKELYASYKNRAILYCLIYDELRRELGQQKAVELLRRAIYRRGEQIGAPFAAFAPDNLAGLRDAFVGGLPDGGEMFGPVVDRCDENGLDITFHNCPLKDAWREMGISDEDCEQICQIAATIDTGTFEGAGFRFSADTWQPGRRDCCRLHIRPGK